MLDARWCQEFVSQLSGVVESSGRSWKPASFLSLLCMVKHTMASPGKARLGRQEACKVLLSAPKRCCWGGLLRLCKQKLQVHCPHGHSSALLSFMYTTFTFTSSPRVKAWSSIKLVGKSKSYPAEK